MKPLTVQVDIPSSSAMVLKPKKNGKENYEVVNYGEITFPNNWHSKRLGRGSYGTVIECFFRGRPAAAKLVENGNDHSQIRSEAELLHGFSHANIVKLYALFHGEMSGLVLELMEGRSLSELLHQGKHITYQACHALHWANHVCEALCYLHAHNYIHRDIKPSNMLLTRDYKTLKLCDFGTVAELKTSMTDNRGTAAWMAPEVFRGRRYDQKCDIFSFGISFWEMVTRRQPFTDLNETNPVTLLWKVAENGLRPPRISDLPKPLMDLIERCWQNDPEERPCLEEVKRIIEAFIEIFPNAKLLPLVDRTTAKQALAQSTWEKYRNMQSSGVSAPPTPPTTIPLPPLSTYYAAAPQLPPTINVQNSLSPVPNPNHLPPLPPNLLHSTQSQIIIHRPVGQQLLPIPGQANPYFPHQQSGLHLPHPNPIHLSHSLMDITSSPSSTYQPCRTSPSFMPPNNYPATSLPPPDIQDESQLGQEKKCKKSYIRRWIRGLKNF